MAEKPRPGQSLATAAYALAQEIWDGKWDHVGEVKSTPIGLWKVMPVELEQRCPGHLKEQYSRALSRAMFLP